MSLMKETHAGSGFRQCSRTVPLGGRDGCVGVNNYWSNIQFAAMYYLKVAASPVFFERYKQCLHTLMIALLILNNDFGRIFGNR